MPSTVRHPWTAPTSTSLSDADPHRRSGPGDYPGRVPTLCLDTSAGSAVAVHDGDHVLARARRDGHRGHAEHLTPLIDAVLREARLSPRELERIAVGTGPAPFTGLRVGLVTAAALGRALGIAVHGVSSLDALARQTLDLIPGATVLVATDARRREVYSARYRENGPDDVTRVDGPQVGPAAELALDAGAELVDHVADGGRVVVTGGGALLYPEHLPPTPGTPDQLDPAVLGRIVAARLVRLAAGEPVELGTEPLYLRRPDVSPASPRKRAT